MAPVSLARLWICAWVLAKLYEGLVVSHVAGVAKITCGIGAAKPGAGAPALQVWIQSFPFRLLACDKAKDPSFSYYLPTAA